MVVCRQRCSFHGPQDVSELKRLQEVFGQYVEVDVEMATPSRHRMHAIFAECVLVSLLTDPDLDEALKRKQISDVALPLSDAVKGLMHRKIINQAAPYILNGQQL